MFLFSQIRRFVDVIHTSPPAWLGSKQRPTSKCTKVSTETSAVSNSDYWGRRSGTRNVHFEECPLWRRWASRGCDSTSCTERWHFQSGWLANAASLESRIRHPRHPTRRKSSSSRWRAGTGVVSAPLRLQSCERTALEIGKHPTLRTCDEVGYCMRRRCLDWWRSDRRRGRRSSVPDSAAPSHESRCWKACRGWTSSLDSVRRWWCGSRSLGALESDGSNAEKCPAALVGFDRRR